MSEDGKRGSQAPLNGSSCGLISHVLRKQPSGLEDTQRQADCERGTQLFAAAEILR
jgi:hypothetical protein